MHAFTGGFAGANRKSVNRTRARQGAAAIVMNSLLRFASFLAPGPFILDEPLPIADTATTEGRTNPPTSPLLSSPSTGVGRRTITMANAIQVPLSVTPEAVLEKVYGMARAHPSGRLVISSPTGDFTLDPIHYVRFAWLAYYAAGA